MNTLLPQSIYTYFIFGLGLVLFLVVRYSWKITTSVDQLSQEKLLTISDKKGQNFLRLIFIPGLILGTLVGVAVLYSRGTNGSLDSQLSIITVIVGSAYGCFTARNRPMGHIFRLTDSGAFTWIVQFKNTNLQYSGSMDDVKSIDYTNFQNSSEGGTMHWITVHLKNGNSFRPLFSTKKDLASVYSKLVGARLGLPLNEIEAEKYSDTKIKETASELSTWMTKTSEKSA